MSIPALPKLMLIADGFASGRANQTAGEVQRQVVALVEAGLSFVQLRDHAVSASLFEETAGHLVEWIRASSPDVMITVNSREETASALRTGIHIGQRAARQFAPSLRGKGAGRRGDPTDQLRPLGYSAHTLEDLQHAATAGFDYATFSPIFRTTTHPDSLPVGLEELSKACVVAPDLPVFALGGIAPERVQDCLDAGAYGVAVLSSLLDAPDPEAAVRSLSDLG